MKKAQLQSAINTMEAMEVKKFKYAAKSNGDLSTPLRQSMVDKATQDISDLQDDYDYDPETGTYISKKDQKPITPLQFTDMKNTVATKLDQQLTQKKMKPLGVRFSVSDASWHDAQGLGRNAGKAGVAPENTERSRATAEPAISSLPRRRYRCQPRATCRLSLSSTV